MTSLVLLASGLALAGWGTWRGYVAARSALVPLAGPGDPTRSLVDATRPLVARPRVRSAVRSIGLAVGWVVVALYGLFLATAGLGAAP
jgi:hypothetical protein